jgi:hypothetical protein
MLLNASDPPFACHVGETSRSVVGLLTLFALNRNVLFPHFDDLPRCKDICGWVSLHKQQICPEPLTDPRSSK